MIWNWPKVATQQSRILFVFTSFSLALKLTIYAARK